MKKITALAMVLILAFSMAITVSADDTNDTPVASVALKKLYTVIGTTDTTVLPHETLKFDSTPATGNPTEDNLTIANLVVSGTSGTMSITLPEYTKIGEYVYTVSESPANDQHAQGVTYAADDITLTVLVSYDTDHNMVTQLFLTQKVAGNGTQTSQIQVNGNQVAKVDTFVNTYEVGHMTVSKTVSGNLGSHDVEFDIDVTFTADKPVLSDITYADGNTTATGTIAHSADWKLTDDNKYTATATISVKNGETVTFRNIPKDVTYVVEEQAKHGVGNDGFDPNSDPDTDYTVTYTNKTGTIAANSTLNATVTNTKNTVVETGIALDSMPYVLILAAAVLGMAALLGKKRYEV